MSCQVCQRMFPIASNFTTLSVGTVQDVSTAFYVYVQDITIDRLFRYSVTSDGSGLLSFNPSHTWMQESTYKLWVVKQSDSKLYDGEEITVDGMDFKCLEFTVEEVIDYNGDCQTFTTQTLHICD